MLKYIRFFSIFAVIAFCSNCATDFELNSEWKEIAIVYGLLDQSQERQFIRLTKAFLSEENALEVAQVADSLYFENATVVINEYKANVVFQQNSFVFDGAKQFIKTIPFERVEASADPNFPQKEEGTFANLPFYLYYSDEPLNADMVYELVVTTPSGQEVTSITPLVKDFTTYYPVEPRELEERPDELNFLGEKKPVRWRAGANAEIFDVNIEFKYREAPNNDANNDEIKTIDYTLLKSVPIKNLRATSSSTTLEKDLYSDVLLEYLALRIGTENAEDYKRFLFNPTFTFTFFGGTEALKVFTDVANVSGNSVNSGAAKPIFSNITNGYGLFAARYKKEIPANFAPPSLEKFFCGEITGDLRFIDSANQVDCN